MKSSNEMEGLYKSECYTESYFDRSKLRHDLKSQIRNLKLIVEYWEELDEVKKHKYKNDFERTLFLIKNGFKSYTAIK